MHREEREEGDREIGKSERTPSQSCSYLPPVCFSTPSHSSLIKLPLIYTLSTLFIGKALGIFSFFISLLLTSSLTRPSKEFPRPFKTKPNQNKKTPPYLLQPPALCKCLNTPTPIQPARDRNCLSIDQPDYSSFLYSEKREKSQAGGKAAWNRPTDAGDTWTPLISEGPGLGPRDTPPPSSGFLVCMSERLLL